MLLLTQGRCERRFTRSIIRPVMKQPMPKPFRDTHICQHSALFACYTSHMLRFRTRPGAPWSSHFGAATTRPHAETQMNHDFVSWRAQTCTTRRFQGHPNLSRRPKVFSRLALSAPQAKQDTTRCALEPPECLPGISKARAVHEDQKCLTARSPTLRTTCLCSGLRGVSCPLKYNVQTFTCLRIMPCADVKSSARRRHERRCTRCFLQNKKCLLPKKQPVQVPCRDRHVNPQFALVARDTNHALRFRPDN